MTFEAKNNSGVLFRNDKREKETHPNARGTALIDGVAYEISCWTKEGRNGKFQSLSFKRKDAPADNRPARSYAEEKGQTNSYGTADDGDLPF